MQVSPANITPQARVLFLLLYLFKSGEGSFVGPKLLRNELPLDKWVKDMEEKEKPCLEVNDMTIRDHP